MIAQSMVWLAAVAALLALAARALEEVLRSYGRSTRWAWVAALCGSAALPLLALATEGAFPGRLLRGAGESVDLTSLLALAGTEATSSVVAGGSAGRGPAMERALVVAWPAASLLALLVYAATWLRLARSRRRWRAGEVEGTPVLLSARGGPAVLGLIRPSIVVPEWLRSEPADAQRMILLHEREHVRAGDHVLLALAPLFAIAMPWNLPLWWQLRRLRLAIEVDCDRRVLARGVAPGAYGTLLLDIARRGGAALAGAAALAEPRTFLERRILAMSSTIPTLRLPRAIALSALAIVFALAACEATTPMNVGAPEPHVPETGTVVASPELPLEVAQERVAGDPLIVIDGVIVQRKLDALTDPNEIERIEVLKGEAAAAQYGPRGENGVIQIFTKQTAGEVERRAVVEQMLSNKIRLRAADPERVTVVTEQNLSNKIRLRQVDPERVTVVAEQRAKVALVEKQRSAGVEETARSEVERQKVLVEEERANSAVIRLRERAAERDATPDPVFMIDDVVVDAVDLDRLPPDRIERIEVVKGMAAAALGITDGRGLIRIYTKK